MGRGKNFSEETGNPPNPAPQFYQMNGFEDWYVEVNEAGEEIIHLVESDEEENLQNVPAGDGHVAPEVNENLPVEQVIMDVGGEVQNGGAPQHVEAGHEPPGIDGGMDPHHGDAVVNQQEIGVQVNMVRGSRLKRRATRGGKGGQQDGQPAKKRGRKSRPFSGM